MTAMNWRQRLGAFIGGFDAGQHHRRLRGFRATRAHVNALIAASGPDITARARWLVRNNGYATNAVESWAANTAGDGIKPISKIADPARKEELQRLWLDWTDEADAEGLTDFYGLQRRAAREVFIAGEVFFPHPAAARGRRAERAAAAADAARRDAAAGTERHRGEWQCDPSGDRVRPDRAPRRLSLPAAPPRRQHGAGPRGRNRPGAGLRGDPCDRPG